MLRSRYRDILPPATTRTGLLLGRAREAAASAVRFAVRRRTNHLIRSPLGPLIHPEARMIVIFSPKSACTSVVIWFLHHLGHAERARQYSEWPHHYRAQVYYQSSLFRDACNLDLTNFRVVRVVRDPFDRAASSFRHAQRSGVADDAFAKLLGLSDAAHKGVSFCDFLDLLDRLDLTNCDEHLRLQHHPVEGRLQLTHLINISIEDLFERLNMVEADLGLPITDFTALDWLTDLDRRRRRFNGAIDVADAYTMPLTRRQAQRGPWPNYHALLTQAARERISRLYAADISAYGASAAAPPSKTT